MENLRKVLLGIIIGMSICMIAFVMTSCSGSRVGCTQHSSFMGYR